MPAPVTDVDAPARIRSVIGRLGRRLRQTRAGADLSPSQAEVLVTVVQRGPLRLSEVATIEGLNPTMVSRIAGKLEAAGLIGRAQDPSDRRAAFVTSTVQGRELVVRIRRERTDALTVALEGLSAGDRQALEAALPVLENLAEALKDRRP
jgi:DNA-binding MarR family transcriptional regulator